MGLSVVVRSASSGTPEATEPPLSLTFDSPRVVIGRGDGCEVRLPDASVSMRHASVRQHGGSYLVVDEGSTNGTFVGGMRLAAHAPRVVNHGDLVRVGRVWLELRLEAVAQPSTQQATRELALSLVQRALSDMGEHAAPRLVVRAGPDAGQQLPLPEAARPYVIGRGNGVDLTLDETDASRRHVQLVRKAEQLLVRDLGSKNGTFVGEQRLEPGRDAMLRAGDEIRIGQDHFVYENPAADALAELDRCADEPFADDGGSAPSPDLPPDDDLDPTTPAPPEPGALTPAGSALRSPSQPPPSSALAPPRTSSLGAGQGRPSSLAQQARSGWGASDFIIVLLALGVLGLSIGGLWLLFKGG
jgi:pSer/pThr/pTyr-binding forkhead associated (FHA) protein